MVLRRPDGAPVCLSDSRWTQGGHRRALDGGWMPFPSPASEEEEEDDDAASTISALTFVQATAPPPGPERRPHPPAWLPHPAQRWVGAAYEAGATAFLEPTTLAAVLEESGKGVVGGGEQLQRRGGLGLRKEGGRAVLLTEVSGWGACAVLWCD